MFFLQIQIFLKNIMYISTNFFQENLYSYLFKNLFQNNFSRTSNMYTSLSTNFFNREMFNMCNIKDVNVSWNGRPLKFSAAQWIN